MIKYFKELEKPNDTYLTLIKNQDNNIRLENVPISYIYLQKHNELFNIIRNITTYLSNINLKELFKQAEQNSILSGDYENLSAYQMIESFISEEFNYIYDDLNKINLDSNTLYYIINSYIKVLENLQNIYQNNQHQDAINYLITSANDLNQYLYIKDKTFLEEKIYLPNSWYITPCNTLYNNDNNVGHKEANLIYPYRKITKYIYNNIKLTEFSQSYIALYKDILSKGYVTKEQYRRYLNYIYLFPSIDEQKSTHNKKIIKMILGIILAEAQLYSYFEKLQKYTTNPKKELEKIKELTKDEISDILVRCCGFHKSWVSKTKVITTSDINYESDFVDYLNNKWRIDFVPPIIINHEKRCVEELDVASPIVSHYLEKKKIMN